MDVDPHPTRPKTAFLDVTGSGGRLRPTGPHRSLSNQSRGAHHPYQALPPHRPPPSAAETATKWNHDLFAKGSNIYNPAVNFGQPQSSSAPATPSLRPFGNATPPVATSSNTFPFNAPSGPAATLGGGGDLATRLGIRGSSANAVQAREAVAAESRAAKLAADRAKREEAKNEARRKKEQQERMKEREKLVQIANIEKRGFVVEVKGLVWGTSSEDVQTAFSQYGETTHCFLQNEETAQEGEDLVARLVFKMFDDAENACAKLNGAIADGRPLQVTQVNATPMPPELDLPLHFNSISKNAPIPTGPKASSNNNKLRTPMKAPPAVYTPPAAKTMYADEVESLDPRFGPASAKPKPIPTGPRSQQNSQAQAATRDVEMEVDDHVPREPRAARGAGAARRGGRGGMVANGGGGGGGGSLLNRMQGVPPQQQQQAQNQQKKGGNSLLARLG